LFAPIITLKAGVGRAGEMTAAVLSLLSHRRLRGFSMEEAQTAYHYQPGLPELKAHRVTVATCQAV